MEYILKHLCRNILWVPYTTMNITSTNSENNKRIAKNTLLLYVRMLFTVAVGLYTSRVVLNTLGTSDYGLYNVVGGIVAMFAFLNAAMIAASQRFISYELGRKDPVGLKDVFCTSVSIHIAIALIILILAETIGIWFLNNHLNIPTGREYAANILLQTTVFAFMITVISVPYDACIVAHEHMKVYAYFSIVEVSLKLLIVFLLQLLPFDKLITYGFLVLAISVIMRIMYGVYCKHRFEECSYHFVWNEQLFKKMFTFAGWSLVGNLGFSVKDQLSNIILNLFFGTLVNAARGISMQVNGILYGFANNFLMALNPPIIKSYSSGDLHQSQDLVYAGCKYSVFLLALIAVPFMVNVDYILLLWLKIVPQYTADFLRLVLVSSMIYVASAPLSIAMQATGNIRLFQITVCAILLCTIPLLYIVFTFDFPPYSAMWVDIFLTFCTVVARIWILKRLIPSYSIRRYLIIILRSTFIIGLAYGMSSFIHHFLPTGFIMLIIDVLITLSIVSLLIYILGLSVLERQFINAKILKLIKYKE